MGMKVVPLRRRSKAPEEERPYFAFSAALRIHGQDLELAKISQKLGLKPSHVHRRGERRNSRAAPWKDDAWHFQPDLDESRPLGEHLDALWIAIAPKIGYLKSLKSRHRVDVFCGYRSNSDTAGFEVPYQSLKLFAELEVPFSVSVIIA